MKEAKQVIVWRADLKVRKGKCMAQAAHSSVGALLSIAERKDGKIIIDTTKDKYLKQWLEGRFKKVTLQCENEKELVELYNQAKSAGLICCLITDAGLTEFNGVPTKTCIGIGPADPDEIDKITGDLKLY